MTTRGSLSRRRAAAVALACFATALSCSHDSLHPVAPTWDANVTMPLTDRTVSLMDIVNKEPSLLQSGAGSRLEFSNSSGVAPTLVSDRIVVNPSPASSYVRLGRFVVDIPPVTLPLQFPDLPGGTSMVIPPMSFQGQDIPNALTAPGTVHFAAGRVRLTLTNNLPVAVSVDSTIRIWDGTSVLARFTFTAPIPAGGSSWAEDTLGGRTFAGGEELTGLGFHTQGSGGASVMIPRTAMTAAIAPSNMLIDAATVTSVPAQRLPDADYAALALRDSTEVQFLMARSGRLDFTFTSRFPVDVRLLFGMNELRKVSGGVSTQYHDSVMLPAQSSLGASVDLSGFQFIGADPSALIDTVRMVCTFVIPYAVNRQVTLHDTDRVMVDMRCGVPIVADSASVVLKPTWVNVRDVVPLNFGDIASKFSGQLNIPSASLKLTINSAVGFPADLYLTVKAKKVGGDSAVLTIPAGQRRVIPGTTTISFTNAEVGLFLTQLSSRLPDSANISGTVLINPPDAYTPGVSGIGRIGSRSSVGGAVNLSIPFTLGLVNGVYRDTVAWNSDNSFDRGSLNNVNDGKVYAEIQNGMPMQVGMSLGVLGVSRLALLAIPQDGSQIQVASGNAVNDSVTVSANSSAVIELKGSEARQFIPAAFISYTLTLNAAPAPGSTTVTLRTNQAIHVKVWSILSYRVKQ